MRLLTLFALLLFASSVTVHGQGTSASEAEVDGRPLCGPNCLYVALRSLDIKVASYDELLSRFHEPERQGGVSMGELNKVAESYGAHTLLVHTSLDNLASRKQRFSCLAFVQDKHFLLITDVHDGNVTLIDPPHPKTVPASTLETFWRGEALLLSVEPLVTEENLVRSSLPWSVPALLAAFVVIAYFIRRFVVRKS